VTTPPAATLVPPVRLGRLLGEARAAHGETYADLARRCGLAFDENFFAQVEAGRAQLDEPLVRWIAELYGVTTSELVPARSELIIDLTEGHLSVGERRVSISGRNPDQILTNYLALVYALRGLPVGTSIPLRQVDLGVLGQALDLSTRDVGRSLGQMMTAEHTAVRDHARTLRRRLVVPVAGILVGVTAAGALLLVRGDDTGGYGSTPPPAGPVVSVSASVPVAIGDAVVLERSSVRDPSATQVVRNG
jgi:transcriptional regulator with XRE-family HTH domain